MLLQCYLEVFIFHGCVPSGNELSFMLTFQVVDAMRQTVTNMIGTLPPQFFAVTVTTVRVILF
jgi:hypothetical protein